MAENKEIKKEENLFVVHRDEINKAYERAVREALLQHKQSGNYVVTSRDGEVVIIQPSDIPV
jgi:hypothetical protein